MAPLSALLGIILLASTGLAHEPIRIQDQNLGPILLLTHPTSYFDKQWVAQGKSNEILNHFIRSRRPHYLLSGAILWTSPAFEQVTAQYIKYAPAYKRANRYDSIQGEHRISFKKSRQFVLAGGNFTSCLLGTFVHTLDELPPSNAPVTFYILTDATYDYVEPGVLKQDRPPMIQSSMEIFFKRLQTTPSILPSLKDRLRFWGTEAFQEFLDLTFLSVSDPDRFKFRVMYPASHKSFDRGRGVRIVHIHFVETTEFLKLLNDLSGTQY